MKVRLAILLVGVTLASVHVLPLLAHHSFAAQFDGSKAIRMTGVLTKVEWTSPHSFFYIDVKEEDGSVMKWSCEANSIGALSRQGFKRGDVKVGDTLIVDGYRAKDGSRVMAAMRASLPNGKILLGAGAGDGERSTAGQNP